MPPKKFLSALCGAAVALTFVAATTAWGQEQVLYNFTDKADGTQPQYGLVLDTAGNLYGTTRTGGNSLCGGIGCGVVFELKLNSDGTRTHTTIHNFVGGADGSEPEGNLIIDAAGNLFGTTTNGGNGCNLPLYGCGTVYELSPNGKGSWSETILYSFTGNADGANPSAGLVMDKAGNLFGTSMFGANTRCQRLGCGTVFETTPGANKTWTTQVIYTFPNGPHGGLPDSELILDAAGNLYGAAKAGGNMSTCNAPYGCGVIYRLAHSSRGWTQSVLHAFDGSTDGLFPISGVAADGLGNFYGTMENGGANAFGSLYKLSPAGGGNWNFTVVHSFDGTNGGRPFAAPVFDPAGNLWGTTSMGGAQNAVCGGSCGGVFRLAPTASGFDYTFFGFAAAGDGYQPQGSVTLDSRGKVYGTTNFGGRNGVGTVFQLKPQ